MVQISIVMATFNRSKIISDAIRSVILQDIQNWELIIVDDGSTDDTQSVVNGFNDSRIKYYQQENSGQPSALNFGISKASSEVICFLDSDDTVERNHLRVFLNSLTDEYDFVIGGFNVINYDPKVMPIVRDFYCPERTISLEYVEVLTGVICCWKSAIIRIGGFRNVPSTDTDLVSRLRSAGCKWVNTSVKTYNYHFGRSSDSIAIRERELSKKGESK